MTPLAGRRILITRSRQQASELAARLEALGAATILIPTIEIAPPASYDGLDAAIAGMAGFDWLVFTSANAVQAFRARTALTATPKVAVIGPATAKAAREAGLEVALVPEQAVAESLVEALLPHVGVGARVLLVRAATARDLLPEALAWAGAEVTVAEAYRTLVPGESVAALRELMAGEAPDAVTFTSSSTATNLVGLLEVAGLTLPPEMVRASIGPITSETLRGLGLEATVEAREASTAGLAAALVEYFAGVDDSGWA